MGLVFTSIGFRKYGFSKGHETDSIVDIFFNSIFSYNCLAALLEVKKGRKNHRSLDNI